MKCPYCGKDGDRVIDSRPAEESTSIRRRRECTFCMKRFTTYEKLDSIPFMVVKKDNTRQPFKREKLLSGIIRACEKRPVSMSEMESIINEIEAELQNTLRKEVSSEEIGEKVMNKLKSIDDVAYVRFASVYRQFKDINTFMEELHKLLNEKKD